MFHRKTIRKILITAIWVAVSGGLISLLLAANGRKKRDICADYKVTILGKSETHVVSEAELVQLIKANSRGAIRGQELTAFRLVELEAGIEKNPWVKDAEIWFDSRNVLHVEVKERQPLARVFTPESGSFYLDEELKRLPLKTGFTRELPVFTGWKDNRKWSKKDSLLAKDIITLARFIQEDVFWNAQVEQVAINDRKEFEMIPLVGNQVIRLGDAQEYVGKFERLKLFYEQVLRKTGFEKYETIDLRYRNQVVGVRRKK